MLGDNAQIVPSGFTPGCILMSTHLSSPSHSLCPALSSGIKHNDFCKEAASPISVPYQQLIQSLRYSGSSLPSWLSLSSANLFYREDFPSLHTRGRHGLDSIQGGQSEYWRLEGVRIWKLIRTYPDEKPPSLSVPKQGICLSTRKPTRYFLAMSNIPVGIRVLYEDLIALSVPPAQKLRRHHSQDF